MNNKQNFDYKVVNGRYEKIEKVKYCSPETEYVRPTKKEYVMFHILRIFAWFGFMVSTFPFIKEINNSSFATTCIYSLILTILIKYGFTYKQSKKISFPNFFTILIVWVVINKNSSKFQHLEVQRVKVIPISDIDINKNFMDGEKVTNRNTSIGYSEDISDDVKMVVHQRF